MKNKSMTDKERNLLKGSIRRVFSRSDLRRRVLDAAMIEYFDPKRPRVKKWSRCAVCSQPSPRYKTQVDHIQPIIPVETSLELMTWDDVVDRTWCDIDNLQAICLTCHKHKCMLERRERTFFKKQRSMNGTQN